MNKLKNFSTEELSEEIKKRGSSLKSISEHNAKHIRVLVVDRSKEVSINFGGSKYRDIADSGWNKVNDKLEGLDRIVIEDWREKTSKNFIVIFVQMKKVAINFFS